MRKISGAAAKHSAAHSGADETAKRDADKLARKGRRPTAIDVLVSEFFEERAAIGEYERGMTREESESMATEMAIEYRDSLELPLLTRKRS